MLTTVAVRGVVAKVRHALSSFSGWKELASIPLHFADSQETFFNRFSQEFKGQVASTSWITYFFNRQAVDAEIARLHHVLWKYNNTIYKLPFIARARCSIFFSVLSNSADLLENVEEAIYLRKIPLQAELTITGYPIFSNLGPFTTNYMIPQDSNIQFRTNPTETGSLSEVTFSIEVFYPIFSLPEEVVKEIRTINFQIWDGQPNNSFLLYEIDITP